MFHILVIIGFVVLALCMWRFVSAAAVLCACAWLAFNVLGLVFGLAHLAICGNEGCQSSAPAAPLSPATEIAISTAVGVVFAGLVVLLIASYLWGFYKSVRQRTERTVSERIGEMIFGVLCFGTVAVILIAVSQKHENSTELVTPSAEIHAQWSAKAAPINLVPLPKLTAGPGVAVPAPTALELAPASTGAFSTPQFTRLYKRSSNKEPWISDDNGETWCGLNNGCFPRSRMRVDRTGNAWAADAYGIDECDVSNNCHPIE